MLSTHKYYNSVHSFESKRLLRIRIFSEQNKGRKIMDKNGLLYQKDNMLHVNRILTKNSLSNSD